MAVNFREKRKKQKYLILVVAGILAVTGIVLYFGYKKPEKAVVPGPIFTPSRKIEINYEILESPVLDKLEPFPETPSYEGELGKNNPFLPY